MYCIYHKGSGLFLSTISTWSDFSERKEFFDIEEAEVRCHQWEVRGVECQILRIEYV